MEEIIESEDADMISLSLPLIREPDLPARWLSGESSKARCVSCCRCLETLVEEGGLRCWHLG